MSNASKPESKVVQPFSFTIIYNQHFVGDQFISGVRKGAAFFVLNLKTMLEKILRQRQSVRKYLDKPVEKEKIEALIEAVHLAPSACNSQPWKLIIVDDPEVKRQVAEASYGKGVNFNRFAREAPVIAVLVIEKGKLISRIGGRIKNQEYSQYDIGIAAAYFCLQATDLGLGTCILGWFDEKRIQQILSIPKRRKIGLLITLGYAPEGYKLRQKIRKPIEQIACFNAYE